MLKLSHTVLQVLILAFILTLVKTLDDPSKDLVVTYTPINDGTLSDKNVIVDLAKFQVCVKQICAMYCGSQNASLGYCDSKNKKLCMCASEIFYTSELEGTVVSVDRNNPEHKNCSVACNKRNSYARIWTRNDKSQHCTCLMNQVTSTGITRCDENAITDICKNICQTDSGQCSFNGACLCRKNWEPYFRLSIPFVRKETPQDHKECASICSSYHHDYVPRLFDSKLGSSGGGGQNTLNVNTSKSYKFREKFCLCGEWIDLGNHPETKAIIQEGFQLCTGLKCKRRCGMDEAVCEPILRRSCLCPRQSIIIGGHLWSRLPTHSEKLCFQTCTIHGYDARVIEWNPFISPEEQTLEPRYRKSGFQYLYDGKFCHCIKSPIDMHQYRPCVDEFCKIICGHDEAVCDTRTRRACFCNTHQLSNDLGRRVDPGEMNCAIACRFGLFDAKIIDIRWELKSVDSWGVPVSKYCACIQPVTAAKLTHCENNPDECPIFCGVPEAYCTREKYCWCGVVPNLLSRNPLIRIPNGKEQDECGERCRSWMWPLAMDSDNKPYIYDEALSSCEEEPDGCPKIDTTQWKPEKVGAFSLQADAKDVDNSKRRFCLCAKSKAVMHEPGTRLLVGHEPVRNVKKTPCFFNHTCVIVGNGIHIIS